jgi:AraC-like DNA-binding protein
MLETVLREATIDEFQQDPRGRFVVGRTWLYFSPSEDLSGYLVWGRAEVEDFDSLTRAMLATHMPWSKPHASLIDVTFMESISAGAFDRAVRFAIENRRPIQSTVTKMALVRSTGLASAAASGFFSFVAPFVPVSIFDDLGRALAWLDREADAAALDDVYEHCATLLGASPVVQRLRALLDADPETTLARAAHSLAVSERTLQRRLREAGTSLRRESTGARIRMAERLLVETEASMTEIALRVGCSSAQHFSSMFRSVHGGTPSAWRARQRARPAKTSEE